MRVRSNARVDVGSERAFAQIRARPPSNSMVLCAKPAGERAADLTSGERRRRGGERRLSGVRLRLLCSALRLSGDRRLPFIVRRVSAERLVPGLRARPVLD